MPNKNNYDGEINFNTIVDETLQYEMDLFKYEIGQLNMNSIYSKLDNFDTNAYPNIRYLINLVVLLKHTINIVKLNAGLQRTTLKYNDKEETLRISEDIQDICNTAIKGINGELLDFDIDTDKYIEENMSIEKVLNMLKIKYEKEYNNYNEINYKIVDDKLDEFSSDELASALGDLLNQSQYNLDVEDDNNTKDIFIKNNNEIHKDKR